MVGQPNVDLLKQANQETLREKVIRNFFNEAKHKERNEESSSARFHLAIITYPLATPIIRAMNKERRTLTHPPISGNQAE